MKLYTSIFLVIMGCLGSNKLISKSLVLDGDGGRYLINSSVENIGADSIYFDTRIPMDSVGNGLPPFTISEPGSYYFTQDILVTSGNNIDGITIDSDDVTLDLNGYSLRAESSVDSRDGIYVLGVQQNITIKNGKVSGWKGDGIDASFTDESTFKNLQVENNELDGLNVDSNCLILNCQANNNGVDGIQCDDGSVVVDCSASLNGDNGFEVSEICVVQRCNSYGNASDGFAIHSGSIVEDCLAYQNDIHGFDAALGCRLMTCTANNNGANGFDLENACFLIDSQASNNGYCINDPSCESTPGNNTASGLSGYGNGVKIFGNSSIVNSTFNSNDRVGIRIVSADCFVSNNTCTGNTNVGIYNTGFQSLILRNVCNKNGTNPDSEFTDGGSVVSGNFILNAGSAFGPIVNISGAGDVSGVANSDHPHANIEF